MSESRNERPRAQARHAAQPEKNPRVPRAESRADQGVGIIASRLVPARQGLRCHRHDMVRYAYEASRLLVELTEVLAILESARRRASKTTIGAFSDSFSAGRTEGFKETISLIEGLADDYAERDKEPRSAISIESLIRDLGSAKVDALRAYKTSKAQNASEVEITRLEGLYQGLGRALEIVSSLARE